VYVAAAEKLEDYFCLMFTASSSKERSISLITYGKQGRQALDHLCSEYRVGVVPIASGPHGSADA
jgi:hypothetical protein